MIDVAPSESGSLRAELGASLNCRASPKPFGLTPSQVDWLRKLGHCLLTFYRAQNKLYRQSVAGISPAWVARYLDNGKPDGLVEIGRAKAFRDQLPSIIRPDILLMEEGYTVCELDSVPGGFGLAARLADCYRRNGHEIVGDVTIEDGFVRAIGSDAKDKGSPIAIVVSDESADYRPEMRWLAERLRSLGHEVHAVDPRELSYTQREVSFESAGRKITFGTAYRFFELFDLRNVSKSELLLYLAKAKCVSLTPPPKAYLEEKAWFALFHHPALAHYWEAELDGRVLRILKEVIPPTWILDASSLPAHAVIPNLTVDGRAIQSWEVLQKAAKRNRKYVLKPSGFSELAWGSKGVVVGHDASEAEWTDAMQRALGDFPQRTHILQEYRSPRRQTIPVYADGSNSITEFESRVRLNPYFFVEGGNAVLSTVLATGCSTEKKKIHGMRDAVMTVCAADRSPSH